MVIVVLRRICSLVLLATLPIATTGCNQGTQTDTSPASKPVVKQTPHFKASYSPQEEAELKKKMVAASMAYTDRVMRAARRLRLEDITPAEHKARLRLEMNTARRELVRVQGTNYESPYNMNSR